MENPTAEPPADAYQRTVPAKLAPDEPIYISIEFKNGVHVSLNGKKIPGVELIDHLNEIGGANGSCAVHWMLL